MKITERRSETRTYVEETGVKCDSCGAIYEVEDYATNEFRLYIDEGLCVSTCAVRDICVDCQEANKNLIDNWMAFMKIHIGEHSENEED